MEKIVAQLFGDVMACCCGQKRIDGNRDFGREAMSQPTHSEAAQFFHGGLSLGNLFRLG